MGVIKKILYRGNILGAPRHRNLFLDMEENIHIHYRDLRIEMSRGEFEEFAEIFLKQSRELLEIIREKNYQDGKLPNANQEDVRIWTESRLGCDVKYHPRRFSLEDCGDGYHFHFRNYKFLIDEDEFREIARLFGTVDIDGPYASSYEEVHDLIAANEVDFTLDAGNVPGKMLAIAVAKYHLPKIRDIFKYIGFQSETEGNGHRYSGDRLTVIVRPDARRSALDYRRMRAYGRTQRLLDYLAAQGATIDPGELNLIKCQVIDLWSALREGREHNVDTDPESWIYVPETRQVIFPWAAIPTAGKKNAEILYTTWSRALASLGMGFVKPPKAPFPAAQQAELRKRVDEVLLREIAAFRAVDKIYVMGSAIRGNMGRYLVPFVHGKWVKLGSDVDILVEIDPRHEADIPAHWHFVNAAASNRCAVYHVTQIPVEGGAGEWASRLPHIEFIHHLIDAYVFFPSRGFAEEKDAFLKRFGARLFYDRQRDGTVSRGGEEERIARRIEEIHGLPQVFVERIKASTENAVYKVFSGEESYILKLFKVSGNYHRGRIAEHAAYEEALIADLRERGIRTPGIRAVPEGADASIEACPALLFERIPGVVEQRPEYPLEAVCRTLAEVHATQIERPFGIRPAFHFDDVCMIWLPAFAEYLGRTHTEEITAAFAALATLIDPMHSGENRGPLYARSPSIHCHGDVTPKNFITVDGEAHIFDFNNAFFGPRIVDVVDGAFEFSLAEKYIHLADFARFDAFVNHYTQHAPLNAGEIEDLPKWIGLVGAIKFAKEIRMLLGNPKKDLRRKRALAIAEFVASRAQSIDAAAKQP